MSSALQLQFFMVQAVNYAVIIVKIKCKTHNITNRKRLPWCALINRYNFFSLSMCFTIRHGKRLNETLKLTRLSSLGSFKISASVSKAATSRLGLGSEGLVHIPVVLPENFLNKHFELHFCYCREMLISAIVFAGLSVFYGIKPLKIRYLLLNSYLLSFARWRTR